MYCEFLQGSKFPPIRNRSLFGNLNNDFTAKGKIFISC